MSSAVRQKYWRLVHKGAWEKSKKNFQWAFPLAFGAVVFLLTGLVTGFDKAQEGLTPRLFVGVATVLFAVIGYAYNLFRSAADLYEEQLQAVSRIEQMRDSSVNAANSQRRAERAEKDAQIEDLRRLLYGKQKDQALADKLTTLRRFGITDLLNKKPPQLKLTREHIDAWRVREAEWTTEVLRTMREHGCSSQDIHKVEMIGTFEHITTLHRNPQVSKDLSMLTVRLERIQEIIDKYAE